MHHDAKLFSGHDDFPGTPAPPRLHLAYSTCQHSPEAALPHRRSTDPCHPENREHDEMRPARGILWSALIGGGIWALVWFVAWFIAR